MTGTNTITIASGASVRIENGIISNDNPNGSTACAIKVLSDGSLIMNNGEVRSNTKTYSYAVLNAGSVIINGGSLSANTNTTTYAYAFHNNASSAMATINGGIFSANAMTDYAYAIYVNNGEVNIHNGTYNSSSSRYGYLVHRAGGTCSIDGGNFQNSTTAPVNGTIKISGGLYKVDTNVRARLLSGYSCYELEIGEEYSLGYRYYVAPTDEHAHKFKVAHGMAEITYYETLEDAISYANNNPTWELSIVPMVQDYILPAGYYSIPENVSLVIPKYVEQAGTTPIIDRVDAYSSPSLFKKVTFDSGVHMSVYGTIEVSGTQNSAGQGANGAGVPSGKYGQLILSEGSEIILEKGSNLYAWGFITGDGEIDARRGSNVYEQFQMFDWKGGKNAAGMLNNSKKVFPVSQYFIQNIESPTTYHSGASLSAATSINVSGARVVCNRVQVIGVHSKLNGEDDDIAMFLMDDKDESEDTWVRKSYDVENDKQVYEVNSSARLGAIRITILGVPVIGDMDFNSQNYTLPITSNMKIHLHTGSMNITQNTVLLPGAEIEIDKTSTVTINEGQSLYLYDAEEWNKYVFNAAYAQPVLYSPSAPENHGRHTPVARAGSWVNSSGWWYVLDKPASAAMNVHGTFDVEGALYTTATGANIFSTNGDAGTVYFAKNAPADGTVSQPISYTEGTVTNTPVYEDRTCISAKLKNEEGYTSTKNIAKAGDSYCYIQGAWRNLKTDECFVYEKTEEGTIYYAKPADYVALANGKIENADHTYSSIDGARTFILLNNDDVEC